MARKIAALLPNRSVKLDRDSRVFLKRIEDAEVPEGTEDAYEQWVRATREVEEQAARVDELMPLVEAKGSADPNWPAYQDAIRRYDTAVRAAFGACDKWRYTLAHRFDRVGVPEDEVRAVVIDSLNDKLDDLQFSINTGLLGSKVAQSIRANTSEESAGEPPYCPDCYED